jgi:glycosyltransferase involved in cell wall biosynthesis
MTTSVLQVIRTVDSRQTGGPEELLLSACPVMRQRGHFEPKILLLRKPNPAADPAKDFGNRARALDIPVVALQDIRWRNRWLRSLPGQLNTEMIHMHGQRGNYFVWLMRKLYPGTWGRAALVATVHGWVQDNLIRRVVTDLELRTLRDCDHVITVSELQRQTLLAAGFSPERVTVVRPAIAWRFRQSVPGIAERQAARARWHISPESYVIAAIGRLSTEKRFDLYLAACAEIATRLPEATFLLVGGGKQEEALKAQAAQLGLGDRVIFTGLTSHMPGIYAASDLLMITSDTEGVPHVLLEAMSQGIPVVSTAVGGIPEMLTSGETGLLVPPGEVSALVEAAMRLHDDPVLAIRLAESAGRLVSDLTVERAVEEIEKIYSKTLDRRRAGSAG